MVYGVLLCCVVLHLVNNGFGWTYNERTKTVVNIANSNEVNMIVMGDWGGIPIPPYYSPFEKATAMAMMKYSQIENIDFLLALGDNFYENGVINEYDARFKTTFEDVFNDPGFAHVPWYVLAGNHDHYGNVTGEISYSMHSSRWNFPDLWYAIQVTRPSFSMIILMIDTVTLCGNTLSDDEESQPDGNIDETAETKQLEFISSILEHSKDQYVIVSGHFPVWSIAEHGPTKCLIDKLKPMLEKHNVTAYLSGHDHNLQDKFAVWQPKILFVQHIRESTSNVHYFVSGAVDVVDPSMKHEDSIPKDSLQFHWANILGLGGFATIKATNQSMVFTFNSAVGNVLYQYEMKPRK